MWRGYTYFDQQAKALVVLVTTNCTYNFAFKGVILYLNFIYVHVIWIICICQAIILFWQITGPMVKGIAAIGSSFIAVGIHTGEVRLEIQCLWIRPGKP